MMTKKRSAEKMVRDIRRHTRKKYSSEEKIRIVLKGLRGEESIAELCRKEGINHNVYYRWSKDFMEAGKKRLSGDTVGLVYGASEGFEPSTARFVESNVKFNLLIFKQCYLWRPLQLSL